MTRVSWVIGAGGLLGSAVSRTLRARGERMIAPPKIPWGTADASRALEAAAVELFDLAGSDEWTIYWCAGAGVTDSDSRSLDIEASALSTFLASIERLTRNAGTASANQGTVFFASSAGAIYGGATGAPFTEETLPAPLGAYGEAKLAAENALRSFTTSSGIRTLIGRISNLYGPGQSLTKQQGLISRLCFSYLTRTPISVFVSLDTLRDYVFVDDCAAMVIDCVSSLRTDTTVGTTLKVFGCGQSISIGGVLSEFSRVVGTRPLVIRGSSMASNLQARDLRLRSTVMTRVDSRPKVTLPDGIARTLEDMRAAYLHDSFLAIDRAGRA